MNITIQICAPVYPTEIQEKVQAAITNIFPVELYLQDSGTPRLCAEAGIDSLRKLHQLLREERTLDTARNVLLAGIEGNTIQFRLNKQVAFVGAVNFPAGEESLGSIFVEICAENKEDLLRIIDWLAPETLDGKPIMEIEM